MTMTIAGFLFLAIVIALLALRIWALYRLDRDTFPHKPPRMD